MTFIEIIAAVSGLACVIFTAKNKVIQWPIGLLQVILYIWVFWQAKLYSDAGLQVFYVITGFYGWYYWLHGKDKGELPITKLASTTNFILWFLVGITGTFLWGSFMKHFTDAACPVTDAFIVVMSLIAQWLLTQRKLEFWIFWIMVDVMAVGVYAYKSLYVTSGLYAVFLGLAVWGFFAWRRQCLK